ncbi:MAG: hypothetical protein AAFP82_21575, partial [Bacteroidota bacterium]
NFRLTMLRTGTPVLDIASYNVDILAVGILPTENTATYQALAVSSYLVIPQGDPSPALIPEDMIGLPSGGVAPSYEQLNTAVTTAADSLGLEIDTLSLTDAQNITNQILLPSQMHPMPTPSSATLEAMYTLPLSSPILNQNRVEYESILGSPSVSSSDRSSLTSYIYALSGAHYCNIESTKPTQLRFRFPVRPEAESNDALVTEMEVVLKKSDGTAITTHEVPTAYYYAHGLGLPDSITHVQRCDMAHSDTRTTLINKFTQADTDGVINLDSLAINKHQAARRMDALSASANNTPICEIDTVSSLLAAWLAFDEADNNKFWNDEDTAFPYGGEHLELVMCNLSHGYELNSVTSAPINAISAEDLNGLGEQDWAGLFDGYEAPASIPIHIQLFLSNVRRYFQVTFTPLDIDVPEEATPLNQSSDNPIQQFFECYGEVSGNPFSFDNWDNALATEAIQKIFPNDLCLQGRFAGKILTISKLLTLVKDCPQPLQFSMMEELYDKGFSSTEAITNLSFNQFKNGLAGTIAHQCALEIYKAAGGDPEQVQEEIEEEFTPINPNGRLVNCIPAKHQSVFSPISYLHDLLHLEENSPLITGVNNVLAGFETNNLNDILKLHR